MSLEVPGQRAAVDAAKAVFKRPPPFALVFAWTLCLTAGFINASASCNWGVYVSHMSGTSTELAIHVRGYKEDQKHRFESFSHALSVLVSFVLGAAFCGCFIDRPHKKCHGKGLFGIALVINAILLVVAVQLPNFKTAACCAAFACGLQNAMASSQFSTMLRVTHCTGTLTDLSWSCGRLVMGLLKPAIGNRDFDPIELAEMETDLLRVLTWLPAWACFLWGGVLGAFAEKGLGIRSFYVPAAINFAFGEAYVFYMRARKA